MTDPADLAAAPLARAFLSGDADPVAVTEALLARIAEAEGSAVYITVTAERARAEAEAARARYRAGRPASPLDGVTIAWKDLFDMKGVVTTAGSALLRHASPAERDAPVVAQLAAAGMVALGKVNLTEFAYSGLGLNPHYGTPANPHDPVTPRVPGGSSSGSAVAVAAGLATVAIGSDTGGSIRVPAALNGLVGYKSSEGRIVKDAVFPLSSTLDTVGPIARTVEDCILLDAALRGAAPSVRRADIAALRFVVPDAFFVEECDVAVTAAFEDAVRRLEAAGASVETANVPELAEAARIMTVHGTIAAVEAYKYHYDRVESPEVAEIDGRVVARILRGKSMTALDLITIIDARRDLAASLKARLGGALLLGPTVPHVAPEIAPLDADPAVFNTVNLKTLRNTMVGNFLNTPGVAMPMASNSPLPVSLLVSANGGEDERVLAAAAAIERVVRGD
jgi:aspartyl-tRNA(Asn)/glutamyl-tRNA(Gln) amidotransferase subunit A